MKWNRIVLVWALVAGLLTQSISIVGQEIGSGKHDQAKSVDRERLHNPALWHDPGKIAELDLLNGQGGKDKRPVAPFKFESEDMHGTNPKFNVRDASGTKWRVKLGDEARPEVTASRLLWAVGYFVNDDYVLESAKVDGLQLTRGANMAPDGNVVDARFERKPEARKKIGTWRWKDNPFNGTKEFNGLRVMMAVMNNWDLKDENNAVYEDRDSGRDLFLTSDVGATFGTNGLSWSKSRSKGDVDTFRKSKFITHKTEAEVDFGTPAAPMPLEAANVKVYKMRRDLEWIGKKIPIADARWMGSLLKQLSHQQLVDAFRAGQFPEEDTQRYVEVVESRIKELAEL
ncbi:hypothetical protein [Occallatibacter savannae]|uniref:hypothetical protein n=1 Tax=Occallatibacter savannae TaxID=1002691 RepID=UPI000D689391|nr:hypothetical protein [Occallatibacter savannae]